jgi:hypothetical protein
LRGIAPLLLWRRLLAPAMAKNWDFAHWRRAWLSMT